jgi:hypothetical protein
VEQTATGRPEGVVPPPKVDGGPTAVTEGDHTASLMDECRLGGTWANRPSRPRQRPLLPLLLHTSMTSVLLLNRGAHKLIEGAAVKLHQVLTKYKVGPLTEQHHLLLIGVGVV